MRIFLFETCQPEPTQYGPTAFCVLVRSLQATGPLCVLRLIFRRLQSFRGRYCHSSFESTLLKVIGEPHCLEFRGISQMMGNSNITPGWQRGQVHSRNLHPHSGNSGKAAWNVSTPGAISPDAGFSQKMKEISWKWSGEMRTKAFGSLASRLGSTLTACFHESLVHEFFISILDVGLAGRVSCCQWLSDLCHNPSDSVFTPQGEDASLNT